MLFDGQQQQQQQPLIDSNTINAHFNELQGALHKLQIDVDQLRSASLKPQVSSMVERVQAAIDQYQQQEAVVTSNSNTFTNTRHSRSSPGAGGGRGGLAQEMSSPLIPPSVHMGDSSPTFGTRYIYTYIPHIVLNSIIPLLSLLYHPPPI